MANAEESGTIETTGGENDTGSLISPEGVLMFTVATIFDVIGLIPVVNCVSDIIAAIFFGIWLFTKPDGIKKLSQFILPLILEFIPFVSDATPVISIVAMMFGKKWPASWIGFVRATI